MSLAETAASALNREGVEYRLLAHPRTFSTRQTAGAAHVPADRVAKSVILEGEGAPDHGGRPLGQGERRGFPTPAWGLPPRSLQPWQLSRPWPGRSSVDALAERIRRVAVTGLPVPLISLARIDLKDGDLIVE